MAGKVILVKTNDEFPKLIPATALTWDGESDTVTIDRMVEIDHTEALCIVPKSRCYEFDVDLMNNVNALTESALMNLSAAQQLCDAGLLEAEFVTNGDPGKLKKH